ncbi:hypothetical protein SADUNF_Sadunf16G0074500 [Salix dunnii]|uniref:Uncharacterized protein n=1 Tax=Salix dunnii TaxID=1413687 RepID=A0A835J7I2_9ROSI|nr:hypothetical protein SADUNF_Sadunf16G0074500 [Salix dunnii]
MRCFWEHGNAKTKTWVLGGWPAMDSAVATRFYVKDVENKRRELNLIALNLHGVRCLSFTHADVLPSSSNKTALINGTLLSSRKKSRNMMQKSSIFEGSFKLLKLQVIEVVSQIRRAEALIPLEANIVGMVQT